MADYCIAASQFTKSTLVENGVPEDRVAVIPYGIDLTRYSIRKDRISGKPLRLLFVGSLSQRKGIKYLLDAVESFSPNEVELTVCGRPVDDMALFRNTKARVRLFPSISAAGLIEAYHNADVFVFPSLAEGFAQVLLEAMASGLPIISTPRTAAPDLIRHGHEGFIVRPESVSDLAQHIENFLRTPGILLPMSAAARRRAEDFTWRRFRRGVADFVNSIASDRKTAVATASCSKH